MAPFTSRIAGKDHGRFRFGKFTGDGAHHIRAETGCLLRHFRCVFSCATGFQLRKDSSDLDNAVLGVNLPGAFKSRRGCSQIQIAGTVKSHDHRGN